MTKIIYLRFLILGIMLLMCVFPLSASRKSQAAVRDACEDCYEACEYNYEGCVAAHGTAM
jgi:hypothetical protein